MEGYLGNNKLQLIVEPKYARAAMDIYQEMDTKRFFRAAVLDTEKLTKDKHQVQPGALAEVVKKRKKRMCRNTLISSLKCKEMRITG